MPAKLTGKFAIFNIDGTVALTGTGMLATDEGIMRSASMASQAQTTDLKLKGVTVTRAYTDRQRSIDITMVPYDPDNPGSLATLSAKVKLPVEGTVVTLADWASPDFNGTWNFESGSIAPQDNGYLQMTLRISRVGETSDAPASLTPQA